MALAGPPGVGCGFHRAVWHDGPLASMGLQQEKGRQTGFRRRHLDSCRTGFGAPVLLVNLIGSFAAHSQEQGSNGQALGLCSCRCSGIWCERRPGDRDSGHRSRTWIGKVHLGETIAKPHPADGADSGSAAVWRTGADAGDTDRCSRGLQGRGLAGEFLGSVFMLDADGIRGSAVSLPFQAMPGGRFVLCVSRNAPGQGSSPCWRWAVGSLSSWSEVGETPSSGQDDPAPY